jgi:hypothetical protein
MSFTKFASYEVSEVLDLKGTKQKARTASLDKLSDYHDYRTDDGYLYARIRAISSRVNKNHDGWPSVELAGGDDAWHEFTSKHQSSSGFTVEADAKKKYGYSTFVGKPIFVDHHNSNPKRARGVIVDAKLHVEDSKTASELDPYYADAPDNHNPPTWVELLLEVDAKSFPKLAKAVIEGSKDPDKGIDGFSMGCDVEKSKCNICDKTASSPDEYCEHVRMKGATFNVIDKTGKKVSRKSYEDCYGIKFFEISAVFDPADETALTREIIEEKPQHERDSAAYEAAVQAMSEKLADNPLPQSELTKAPEPVDTLREQKQCEICGSDMEGEKCDVCGHVEPPEGFNNPDLTKAQGDDDPLALSDPTALGESPEVPQPQQLPEGTPPAPGTTDAVSYLQARKPSVTSGVMSEMAWTPSVHPRIAGRLNSVESPKPSSNEPVETVLSDQTAPVTSRTADTLIAGAERNQGTDMSDQSNRVAAEPADPSGKPDKKVPTDGVGGVIEDTNEQASKPDANVDVEGKGSTGPEDSNAEATKPDEKDNLPTAGRDSDDSGFNKDKPVSDSGPTKTFDNSNEPGSAVTDKAWPSTQRGSAKQGVQPGDPVFKPDERVDVEKNGPTPNPQEGTDQWTGTSGNGVTRQQDPVTRKVDPNIEGKPGKSSAKLFAAFRLADTEVELGMTPAEEKYDRVSELEGQSIDQIEAAFQTLARVKTAGLSKQAATTRTAATRVPSLQQRTASTTVESSATDDGVLDAALFSR